VKKFKKIELLPKNIFFVKKIFVKKIPKKVQKNIPFEKEIFAKKHIF